MTTSTRFVFLMHPKEYKQEKAATGRLTHLCLANSELHVGVGFDEHTAVQSLLRDPQFFPVLLYPGPDARNLSAGGLAPAELGGRTLLVFLLDATWSCARKMLRLSPGLGRLPRIGFTPSGPSRFVIKQQPQAGCLSTLEAVHGTLAALEPAGLDRYPDPTQLPGLLARMQEFQLRCAADPGRAGYRRRAYRAPEERRPARNSTRRRFLPAATGAPPPADRDPT